MAEHYNCPECGASMNAFAEKYLKLQTENSRLQDKVSLLKKALKHWNASLFIASAKRNKFHRPTCVYAGYIYDSKNLIPFSSHEEAVAAGYKPCQTCCA